jgi:nitrite reductase/ring-hydroxylating ferredoxin subunit
MVWQTTEWTVERLGENGNRAHFVVEGRYVTVLRYTIGESIVRPGPILYCIDSACGHAAGPLGAGPLADIEDIPCIRCPWHNFLFALDTGERVTQDLGAPPTNSTGGLLSPTAMKYPMEPWPDSFVKNVKRGGRTMQRVFPVEVAEDGFIRVDITLDNEYVSSDSPTTHQKRGPLTQSVWEANGNSTARVPGQAAALIETWHIVTEIAKPLGAPAAETLPKAAAAADDDDDEGGPPGNPRSDTPAPE